VEPDLALLERWRAGDRQAGEELFVRHFPEIYRFFEHKVPEEADDLAQRTFLACLAARDRFRSQSSFRTYLFAIARNELYGHFRRLPHGEAIDFDAISIAAIATSLRSRLGRAQEIEQLRAALRELPAEQQLLMELHYWHGMSPAALGEVFEASAGAIRVRLLRARRALRARMAQHGGGGPAGDPMAASLSEPEIDGDEDRES
jgi:RNA polymerase sigma factor (sigma-70 family)